FSVLVPFWLIWAFAGFRGMIQIWPAILVTGVSFAVPQYLMSNFHGPTLVDVVASVVSMACLFLFLKVWQPKNLWLSTTRDGSEAAAAPPAAEARTEQRAAPPRDLVIRAWIPWLILSVLVFLWGLQ